LFGRPRRAIRTPKGTLTVLFLPLLGLAGQTLGWSAVLPQVLSGVAGACLTELLVGLAQGERPRWPSSALLSGLIVAFVLGVETLPLVTLAVASLATASKHVQRTRRGHLYNPAALALLSAIPLYGTGQSWWGALPDLGWLGLLVVLAIGAILIERLNRWPLVLSFSGAYFGLFTLLALVNPVRVAEMFRAPFVQSAMFLAFFMLTDPPTSPGRERDQVQIGVLVAVASCVAQLVGAGQAYLLIGLLVGNLVLAARRWYVGRQSGLAAPHQPSQSTSASLVAG
jgi:Na+-translocating ferredoxin:NAD+ oxidoreductase RnfD subunit